MNLIDFNAMLPRLQRGKVRCAIDWPAPAPEFENLTRNDWFNVQSHSAYNTYRAVQNCSDAVTDIAISLLADK